MSENKKPAEVTLPDEILVKIGFGASKIKFLFRMLTLAEEQEWSNTSAAGLDGPRDMEKEYHFMVDRLAEVSKAPLQAMNADEHWVDLVDGADAAASIRQYFSDFSAAKERIVGQTFLEYRNSMVPTRSFL